MRGSRTREATRGSRGAVSVELLGVLPALLLALLIAAQIAAAGHALWSAAIAARAGSRAAIVGGDAERAARRALPAVLRRGAQVEAKGAVSVRVAVPRLAPVLPRFEVGARSGLGEPGGG